VPDVQQGRGTQSFVYVMSAVWRRPSVAGLEILWRWVIGAPLIALIAYEASRAAAGKTVDIAALERMTVFQPVAAFHTIDAAMATIVPVAKPIVLWLFPLAFVGWLIAASLGRTVVLRRFDHKLYSRPVTLLVLGGLRAALLTALWVLWFKLILKAGQISIIGSAARGGEPNLVLYCAMLICGTLVLYVLWGVVSWPFYLAPLLAMQRNTGPIAALQAAFRSTSVWGRLIEINLVMNIVRIALIVLALVFSASPLPFSNVETQTFLNCWWSGVMLLYLSMSDYFHVVRSAAYLLLWRADNISSETTSAGG
jgi:hypothetical protein